jgi:hypothetical protein
MVDWGIYLDDDVADDNNKPVWPTWAMGALFRGVRCIHIDHVCENILIYNSLSHNNGKIPA